MPVVMKPWSLFVACCLLGCGPEAHEPPDWMLAGLSERGAGVEASDVRQWDFDADGNVTVTGVWTEGECGNRSATGRYLWQDAGPGAIEITDLDGGPLDGGGGTSWDRAVFQIGQPCYQSDGSQPVGLLYYKDGEQLPAGPPEYVRGKVCLEELPPCTPEEVECGSCRTVWCDGEPPDPYECDW